MFEERQSLASESHIRSLSGSCVSQPAQQNRVEAGKLKTTQPSSLWESQKHIIYQTHEECALIALSPVEMLV